MLSDVINYCVASWWTMLKKSYSFKIFVSAPTGCYQKKKMGVELKRCIFDPKLVKPKCVWEVVDFFNFRKYVYNFQLFVYNFSKSLSLLKRILAIQTKWQKCTVSLLEPLFFDTFQLEHPTIIMLVHCVFNFCKNIDRQYFVWTPRQKMSFKTIFKDQVHIGFLVSNIIGHC